MVLWEITLATAYFLGLKRTYRLALKIQRRVISPKYPKARQFAHRRIRSVFDVALKVHKNIQERDLEVGRNLGNRILRWLDQMKPSANIRGPPKKLGQNENGVTKYKSSYGHTARWQTLSGFKIFQHKPRENLPRSMYIWPKSFPTSGMMLKPPWPAGLGQHSRHFSSVSASPKLCFTRGCFEGVYRKDIMQWMMQS